ncbi:MAG: PASTA domain-containing protein [Desulfobacterales bacterium]|jgi:serine/threonine-protein kinase
MIAKFAKIATLLIVFSMVAGVSAYLTLTYIIKSEDSVIVPNLVGKDVVTALELLSDLQLNTKVSGSEYDRQYPKNHVIYQEPEPGSEIKKDRDIRIILSKGPKEIAMPNLITLSQRQARMIMEENDISLGHLTYTYSNRVENDHVIGQVPPAGSMIIRKSSIDLLVSLGPRPLSYLMPEIAGMSLDKSLLIIERTNLKIGEIGIRYDKHRPRNIVIDQEPPAGYQVKEGTSVNLVVNRKSGKAVGTHLQHSLFGSLLQYRVTDGFLKKRIRVELESGGSFAEIFDDFLQPGGDLWILVPRDRDTTAFIFEDDKLVQTRLYEGW